MLGGILAEMAVWVYPLRSSVRVLRIEGCLARREGIDMCIDVPGYMYVWGGLHK